MADDHGNRIKLRPRIEARAALTYLVVSIMKSHDDQPMINRRHTHTRKSWGERIKNKKRKRKRKKNLQAYKGQAEVLHVQYNP